MISGFLDIVFGDNKDVAKEKMNQRGAKLDLETSTIDSLVFDNVPFAGRVTTFIVLRFFQNEFFQASVHFTIKPESKTLSFYKDLKNDINKKYFITDSDYETYTNSAFKDEAFINLGIQSGYTDISAFWKFPNDKGYVDYITLKIEPNLDVVLIYEDGVIADAYIKYTNELNSEDL